MNKQAEWAKDYVKRFDSQLTQQGSTSVGGLEYELYKMATAIIADMTAHNKGATHE